MNGKPPCAIVPPAAQVAVQDEWGMFDPDRAGLQAAFRAVRALNGSVAGDDAAEPGDGDTGVESSVPDEGVPLAFGGDAPEAIGLDAPAVGARRSAPEMMVRDQSAAPRGSGPSRVVSHIDPLDGHPHRQNEAQPPLRLKAVDRGAVYTLEFPTRCPQCRTEISSVRVSRLVRTQVSFTSTLPRKGYIIVCPECDGILSAELSGLI
jgi:hypothetical protein